MENGGLRRFHALGLYADDGRVCFVVDAAGDPSAADGLLQSGPVIGSRCALLTTGNSVYVMRDVLCGGVLRAHLLFDWLLLLPQFFEQIPLLLPPQPASRSGPPPTVFPKSVRDVG
jgi:hypothetical protein